MSEANRLIGVLTAPPPGAPAGPFPAPGRTCYWGHPQVGTDVGWHRIGGTYYRYCRACRRVRYAERAARARAKKARAA